MNTHEGCADPRAKVQQVIRMAVAAAEEQLGTSIHEHAALKLKPAGLKLNRRSRLNAIYCFRLLEGGGWLPLNRFYRPLGIGAWDHWGGYEAYSDRAVHFPSDPRKVDGIWCGQNEHTLWLFSDDPKSLLSYYVRFARLAAAMCPRRSSDEASAN
jgi:hypothetical protein